MRLLLVLFALSFSALADGELSINYSGLYSVVSGKACASFMGKVNCEVIDPKEMIDSTIQVTQTGDADSLSVCTLRNYKDGIFDESEFCYNVNASSGMNVVVDTNGFNGESKENGFTTFTRFKRTGSQFQIVDGQSKDGLSIYYELVLEIK